MTNEQRDITRSLQDRIIVVCEKRAIGDDMRVSLDMPSGITVGSLRKVIYPKYEVELQRVLWLLESQ